MAGPGKYTLIWSHIDGGAIRLWNFEIDKHDVKKEHTTGLAQWVLPQLKAGGSARVVGLTSRSGSTAHNKALSQRRADEVVGELRRLLGAPPRVLSTVGMGEVVAEAAGVRDNKEDSAWRAVTVFYWRRPDPPPQSVGPPLPKAPNYSRSRIVIPYIHQEMITHANGPEVAKMRDEVSGKTARDTNPSDGAGGGAARGGMTGHQSRQGLDTFRSLVRTNGPWDHKPILTKKLGLSPPSDVHFPIEGDAHHEYYFDIWSNIHYGYVGRAADISAGMLQWGAARGGSRRKERSDGCRNDPDRHRSLGAIRG